MGMRAVTGAVSHVSLEGAVDRGILKGAGFSPYVIAEKSNRALAPEGKPRPLNQLANISLHTTVIGDVQPRGICGSGLVDAVAAGLRCGAIRPNGRIANGTKVFPIVPSVVPPVVLYQSDIRELQLAKAAIAAGFRLLLKRLDAESFSLHSIHLAGAFGNYVQIESALRIGLLEAPHALIHAAGNTALRGAKSFSSPIASQPSRPSITSALPPTPPSRKSSPTA